MEIDKLRPEVREAFNRAYVVMPTTNRYADMDIVRAELLRLADVEAELAAIKAKISKAPRADGQRVFDLLGLHINFDGTLALVKVEE